MGLPRQLLRHVQLLGKDVYTKARETLKNRFGNSHLVSQKIISELKSGKSVSHGQELQQLADELVMTSTALKRLKMLSELDTQQNIRDILVRCPNYVGAKWRNNALKCKNENDRYPTLEEFVTFISKIAADSCDPVYGNEAVTQFMVMKL